MYSTTTPPLTMTLIINVQISNISIKPEHSKLKCITYLGVQTVILSEEILKTTTLNFQILENHTARMSWGSISAKALNSWFPGDYHIKLLILYTVIVSLLLTMRNGILHDHKTLFQMRCWDVSTTSTTSCYRTSVILTLWPSLLYCYNSSSAIKLLNT